MYFLAGADSTDWMSPEGGSTQSGSDLEWIVIDGTHDQLHESALHYKARADSSGCRIAEVNSNQPGPGLE